MKYFFGSLLLLLVFITGIEWGEWLGVISVENELQEAIQEKRAFFVGSSKFKLYPINSDRYCIRMVNDGHFRRTNLDTGKPKHRVRDKEVSGFETGAYENLTRTGEVYIERDRERGIRPETYGSRVTVHSESGSRLTQIAYSQKEDRR